MIKHYGSIAEMCDAYLAIGGDKTLEVVKKGYSGDLSLVALAEEQMAEIESKIETPKLGWTRSVAGAFCSVPDVLAGLPTPMRKRVHTLDETAPITIIVGTASSGGLSENVFKRRGITIIALVMALAKVRPISLQIMDPSWGPPKENGETVIMARVNTTPLDLATACHVLSDIYFTTTVMYALERHVTGKVQWPLAYSRNQDAYYAGLIERLGLIQKDTLIVKDAYLGDEMIQQPIKWLNDQVTRFTQNQEELFDA